MTWKKFEDGKTRGTTGREGGVVLADEEFDGAARIVLEQGCLRAPYAITASLYGYLLHTRFLADEETAHHALDTMKSALEDMVDLMPGDDDSDDLAKTEAITTAVDAFAKRFP